MSLGKTTPILRIFDETKAKEFYVDFLVFNIDWEHIGLKMGYLCICKFQKTTVSCIYLNIMEIVALVQQ